MLIAGLTGGIASGKTTVCGFCRSSGAVIVDADAIARQMVQKGKPAWQAVVEHFGRGILDDREEIDRAALGSVIFNDPAQKQVLNRIVHPRVYLEMKGRILAIAAEQPQSIVVLDVPLLIETGLHRRISPVVLVYIHEALQIKRLMKRDGMNRSDALARINSQLSIESKRKKADIIIDNTGPLEQTRTETARAYRQLEALAAEKADVPPDLDFLDAAGTDEYA